MFILSSLRDNERSVGRHQDADGRHMRMAISAQGVETMAVQSGRFDVDQGEAGVWQINIAAIC
jgi:hypothetical protein